MLGALSVSSAPAKTIEALRHRALEVSEKAYKRAHSGGKDEGDQGGEGEAPEGDKPADGEANAKPTEGEAKSADGKKPADAKGKGADAKKPSGKNDKPVTGEPEPG